MNNRSSSGFCSALGTSLYPRGSAQHRPVYLLFLSLFVLLLGAVEGSASWRIPLGVQLIPGIALGIGCIFLPPSPRLLVAQGRNDEALRTLAKLRLRSEHEIQDDPLLQVRCSAFCHLHPFLCCAPCPWFLRFRVSAFLWFLVFAPAPAPALLSGLFWKPDINLPCFARWLYGPFLDRDARDASRGSTHSANAGPVDLIVRNRR